MEWLKQSTAITLKLGPFLDEDDGKTSETALTIAQADVRLSKNGGNFAQKNESSSATHDEIGFYDVSIDATDTNTLGRLLVAVHESGALPVWKEYMVVPANVWDSMFGADRLQVDVREKGDSSLGLTTQEAADVNAEADTALSDYDPPTRAELTTDKDSIITEVNANETKIDTVDTVVDAIKVITDQLSFTGGNVHSHVKAEDNIDFGAIKKASINTEADTALTDYDAPTRAELTSDKDEIITEVNANETKIDTVDTVVDAIKVITDQLSFTAGNVHSHVKAEDNIDFGAIKKASINTEADTALSDYDPPTKAELDAGFAALNDISAAAVNAEVVDALTVDTIAELTSGAPPATPTLVQAIMLVYMWIRNNTQTTATKRTITNDAGTAIAESTMSDDGTTFQQGELGAPV